MPEMTGRNHRTFPSEVCEIRALSARPHGRSSDSAGYLLASASQPFGQCIVKRSFLLTAAGQLRILTGFPFQPQSHDRGTMKFTHYSKGNMAGQCLYLVVHLQIPTGLGAAPSLGETPINTAKKT